MTLQRMIGDVGGNANNNTVTALQHNPIRPQSLNSVQDGYILTWDGVDGYWSARSTIQSAISQTVWHINQTSGNDNNDGLTSGSAIKTCLEMYRRVGPRSFFNHQVDIYIHADMDPNDILFLSGQFGPNALMSYHGVQTVLHSGTLTGATPYNQNTGQADEITDSSVTDWTPYVGKLIVINTGAPNGPSYCWVAKALTGPARARVSFLGQRDPSNAFFENIGPASPGNTYQIWKLPVLSNFIFDEASYTLQNSTFIFEFLEFPPDANWCSAYVLTYECSFPYVAINAPGIQFNNPLFTGAMSLASSLNFISVIGLALNIFASDSTSPICIQGYWIAYGLILQNSPISIYDGVGLPSGASIQIHHSAYGFGFFDCTNPINIEEGSQLVIEAPIWGNGNTGIGLNLTRGARALVSGNGVNKLLLQSAGGDFAIDNYTSLPAVDPVSLTLTNNRALTFANFFASVASGGFGGAVFNPRFPSTGICNNSPTPPYLAPAPLTQTDWYIDWVNGNDGYLGTIGAPVKTVMGGVVPRWGTNAPKLAQTTTLHIVTPQPANAEEIILKPELIGEVNFIIRGTPQLVATFTLGAVTAKNRTTNTDFAAAGFVAGGLAVGQLVHNNAGGKDSWCFIRHLTAGTAKLTQPLAPLVAGTATLYFPTPAEVDTWTVADSVSVYHPCTLNLRSIAATGGGNSDASVATPGVWMEYIEILDGSGIAGNSTFAPSFVGNFVLMQSCSIDPYIFTFDAPNFTTTIINCYFNGISASLTYILGGLCTTFGLLTTGPNWLDADVIVEAGSGWSGEVSIGLVNLALPGTACHGNAEIRIVNGFGYGAVLWGLGTLNVQAGSLLWNTSGTTWALSYYVATTQLLGQVTGSAYNPHTDSWTSGIALTSANIDLYSGLQDPISGARTASQGAPVNYLTVADWYVDWVAGSDGYAGTIGAPVKTVMGGVVARWGTTSPMLPQTTKLHIITSQPLGAEQIVLSPVMLGNSNFIILGTPLLASSFSLGAVTHKNRATNTDFSAAGFPGGAAIGQLVRNATHASEAWVRTLVTGTAKLTQPLVALNSASPDGSYPAPAEVDTWTAADTMTTYTLPFLNLVSFTASGGAGAASFPPPSTIGWLQYVHVPDQSGVSGTSNLTVEYTGAYIVMTGCYIEPFLVTGKTSYRPNMVNCNLNGGGEVHEGFINGGILSSSAIGLELRTFSRLDGDFIADDFIDIYGNAACGFFQQAVHGMAIRPASSLEIDLGYYGNGIVWGIGTLEAKAVGAVINSTTHTWVNTLTIPTLTIDGLSTATKYVSGIFTDGVALTTANLDGYGSLMSVQTGGRFTKT